MELGGALQRLAAGQRGVAVLLHDLGLPAHLLEYSVNLHHAEAKQVA